MSHSSAKTVQNKLNLIRQEFQITTNVRSRELSGIVQGITGKRLSTDEIRKETQGKPLGIPYLHGTLQIKRTCKNKSGEWCYDVALISTSYSEIPA